MNNQELYTLFKNSRLAQVAKPLNSTLRGSGGVPTHQIIYTPKSSASRSNFGLKTTLPKKIGFSHIVFNDIDNKKNMPDVERYSGSLYNRLKFQESGSVLKNYFSDQNPLFPSSSTTLKSSLSKKHESLLSGVNLGASASRAEVHSILKSNPELRNMFNKWLLQNHPESILSSLPSRKSKLLKEFLKTEPEIKRKEMKLSDISKRNGKVGKILGTGGFSYKQKGRLNNSPNGIKYGVIAMGRLVGEREAAIGGFIANVNDRTTTLQNNYSKNIPGKHSRQFMMPFKINEAEITEVGKVKIFADGVKVGSWMQRSSNDDSFGHGGYQASNPNFKTASERNASETIPLESLLNLIGNKN